MNENEIRKQFDEIYKTKIEPQLSNLEEKRIKVNKTCTIFLFLAGVFFVAMIIMAYCAVTTPNNYPFTQLSVSFVVVAVFFVVCCSIIANNFRRSLKPLLLQPILSIYGNFEILQKEVLSIKEMKEMGLFYYADWKLDDDIIKGSFEDTSITLMETGLYHSANRRNSKRITDFKGLVLKIKLNKNFTSMTIGYPKKMLNDFTALVQEAMQKHQGISSPDILRNLENPVFKMVGGIDKFMKEHYLSVKNGTLCIIIKTKNTRNQVTRQLEQITFAEPELNENFCIFSNEDVEARALLTASFVEGLKEINSKLSTFPTNFVFKDDYLYLFIERPTFFDYFEVGNSNETLFNKNKYLKAFNELATIFSLIDYFK